MCFSPDRAVSPSLRETLPRMISNFENHYFVRMIRRLEIELSERRCEIVNRILYD